jgi:hypothetical protein
LSPARVSPSRVNAAVYVLPFAAVPMSVTFVKSRLSHAYTCTATAVSALNETVSRLTALPLVNSIVSLCVPESFGSIRTRGLPALRSTVSPDSTTLPPSSESFCVAPPSTE